MPRTGRDKRGVPRIAVIVSRYNASITDRLRDGALRAITSRLGPGRAEVVEAPGTYELPAVSYAAAQAGFDGVVALGCLIRGQTRHDRYIAAAVAHGLIDVTLRTGVPVAFGVITAETVEQAAARAGGAKGNKGADAAHAVLDTGAAIESMLLEKPHRANWGVRSGATDKAIGRATRKVGKGTRRR